MNSPLIGERLNDTVLPELTGRTITTAVPVVNEPGRERGQGYYTEAALRITAGDGAQEVELGDGGFTTWTGQLMNTAKERCLISCLATERLSTLADSDAQLEGPSWPSQSRRTDTDQRTR